MRSVAIDTSGNLFSTGGFSATADFVSGAGSYLLTNTGANGTYLLKLAQTPDLKFADKTTLSWLPLFGEASYNVYRSPSGLPGTFVCLADQQATPSTIDLDQPSAGGVFAYLVTTVNAEGREETLGLQAVNGTPTVERPNSAPCP